MIRFSGMIAAVVLLILTIPAVARYHPHQKGDFYRVHHRGDVKVARHISHSSAGLARVKSREGSSSVVSWASTQFQGLILDLQSLGYRVGSPGCYSPTGHMHHSKHHWGGACDLFGQYARDRTRLRQPPPRVQMTLARKHGLISGCQWRNRDCGHFEVATWNRSGGSRTAHRGHRRLAYR